MRIGEVRKADRQQWGKPLDGVRILAAEQMQALPYATQLMSHLGAEVVKVEHPEHGESGRGSQPALTDSDGRRVGATYLRNNLNKQSIGIDLKKPEGACRPEESETSRSRAHVKPPTHTSAICVSVSVDKA